MSRRTSMFDDLMLIGTKLPWPAGVTLALVSFLVLHFLGGGFAAPPAAPTNLAAFGHGAQGQLIAVFAYLLQFIVPPAFLIGAGASFLRRSHAAGLFGHAQSEGQSAIDKMSWSEFERLIGEAFRGQGFAVSENITAGADGGVDLVLRKGTKEFLVQCKQWRTKIVGVSVVRELYGVLTTRSAAGGYVVTSGQFTDEAHAFSKQCSVELVDGVELDRLLGQTPRKVRQNRAASAVTAAPACPQCGRTMMRRTARQGRYVGQEFWGCKAYPKCRGTINR